MRADIALCRTSGGIQHTTQRPRDRVDRLLEGPIVKSRSASGSMWIHHERYAKMKYLLIPLVGLALIFIGTLFPKGVAQVTNDTFVGSPALIHDTIEASQNFPELTNSNSVTVQHHSSGGGSSGDVCDMSFEYFLVGRDAEVSLFMKGLHSHIEDVVRSAKGHINGRGTSGTMDNLYGFDFLYSRGFRDGIIRVRRIEIPKSNYYSEVEGTVYELQITCYEHN